MTESPAVIRLKAFKLDQESDFSAANKEKMTIVNNGSLKRKADDSESLIDEHELSEISIQELLLSFNTEITKRLDKIEQRLDMITETCSALEGKIEQISGILKLDRDEVNSSQLNNNSLSSAASSCPVIPANSGITFITLNTEDAYPNGSWLGNENKVELRVRCPVSPEELLYINTTCTTPEKMALALLDHLFDRETQACSNLSGAGKYKKKRLDPLLIYGIQCHLIHHFRITTEDWNRIKQNIDSKCRTAFRKKIKGIPLVPKGSPSVLQHTPSTSESEVFSDFMNSVRSETTTDITANENIVNISAEAESAVSSSNEGMEVTQENETDQFKTDDVQVVHATPEQLVEIERTHQIQILPGGHILATPFTNICEQQCNSNS